MPQPPYVKSGLVISRGHHDKTVVKALQYALRALGYLRRGIDGAFGRGTEAAVRALQIDLMKNTGQGSDGDAPVSVLNYNQGRVDEVTGDVEQGLARCIADMMADQNFPKIPASENPKKENKRIVEQLRTMDSTTVPMPYLIAILKQEANLKHYNEPRSGDDDTFVSIGLDTNARAPEEKGLRITSRGYGCGQYTLFHHPPTTSEVQDFMLDPVRNLSKAVEELRTKFDRFVNGLTSGTRADDRIAEVGNGALRMCQYKQEDPRFMRDCKACLEALPRTTIKQGTPFYAGSKGKMRTTRYYKKLPYKDVPVRAQIPCDWPYAARRYNGSGVNAYHYQAIIVRNVLKL